MADSTNFASSSGAYQRSGIDEEVDDHEFEVDGNIDRSVWLVKIPKFLSERWAEAGGSVPGVELGKMRIVRNALTNRHEVTLHLPEAQWASTLPKTYNLRFTNLSPQNEYVFTENSQGRATGLAGRVQHEAALNPPLTDDYQSIVRSRTEQAVKPKRTIVMMENREALAESRRLLASSKDSWDSGLMSSAAMRKAAVAESKAKTGSAPEKRERMPKAELHDMLFRQFNEYPYWNLKNLVERTQQPHAYLKEVLAEICILNKRGPYSNHYQLKPEFGGPNFAGTSNPSSSNA